MTGDDMSGTTGFAHVDPAHLETQRFELLADHSADRLHAFQIEGAAILVHQTLEQKQGPFALADDGIDHPPLGLRQFGRRRRRKPEQKQNSKFMIFIAVSASVRD